MSTAASLRVAYAPPAEDQRCERESAICGGRGRRQGENSGAQAFGQRPRDQLRLLVAALAKAVRMRWNRHYEAGSRLAALARNHFGQPSGKPAAQPLHSCVTGKGVVRPQNCFLLGEERKPMGESAGMYRDGTALLG